MELSKEEVIKYLMGLGLIRGPSQIRAEHMAMAIMLQNDMGAYKQNNRYTIGTETLPKLMAERVGCTTNYLHSHMIRWLDTFKAVYDPKDERYARICTPRMLEIITPLQLIYLLTCDLVDNR